MLKAGQIIDQYELVCPIGDGGMATVWAARPRDGQGPHVPVGTRKGPPIVALKIIHSRFAEDKAFRDMFLDEANIVAAIKHPNVANVYEYVETRDHLYLVMEYVDGEALFGLVSQYRTAPLPIALHVVAEACAGLHAAHSLAGPDGKPRNVVHRDISPQNILLSTTGQVRLIDFGIAHARDRSAQATAFGVIKGKIRYMAPEQARREEIGPWTDVFGVGATLFRLIASKAPYASENDISTMQALLANAPAIVQLPPTVPPDVVAVLQQAIAPAVNERFQSAEAFRRALLGVLEELGGPPDIAAWVDSQMSEPARQRHAKLAGTEAAPVVPELASPSGNFGIRGTALMAPIAPVAPPPESSPVAVAVPAGTPIKSTALLPMRPGADAPTKPDGKREPLPPPPAAPQPEGRDASPPGFMDVRAIVANARAVPDLPPPSSSRVRTPQAPATRSAAEPKLELAFQPKNRLIAPPPNKTPIRIALLAMLAVILLIAFFGGLPMVVKGRAIAAAREAGFEMTVDRVGVGLGTATFRGVKLKAIRVPGVSAEIDELHVNGTSMKELRAVGMRALLDGPPSDFEVGLAMLLSENRVRFAGTPQAPRKLIIAGSQISWKGQDGAGFEAKDVGFDAETRGNGNEDARGNVGRLTYQTGKSTIGPWSASLESSPTNTRLRVAFDPALPDGPSILYVAPQVGPAKVTLKIARSPLANLGLRPTELGLPADASTEIETFLEGEIVGGKVSIIGPTSVWGIRVKNVPKPLDFKLEGRLAGEVGKPLDIDRMLLSFGPFTAVVTGSITPQKGNLRVDALAKANAISCDKLARMEAKTMGSFAQMLQAFGESTGILRVRGEVNASAAVKYDTADPDGTSVTWLARETCGLSIFGQ